MSKKLAVMGTAAVVGLFTFSYLTMPLERFVLLAAFSAAVFAGLLYPWALLHIMIRQEEEEQEERSSASRPRSCASLN